MFTAVESDFSIVLGDRELVGVGDYLWGDVEQVLRITPEFAGLEAATFVGGGARMFERAGILNRFHTLEFSRLRLHDTVAAAKRFQLAHFADLPAGGVDLAITLSGYTGSVTLHKAAIIAAPIYTLHQCSITAYTIKGGRLTCDLSADPQILDEAGADVLDQSGDTLDEE